MFLKQSEFLYILSFDAVDAVSLECDTRPSGQGTRNEHSCCLGEPLNAFLPFCVADGMEIVKQMFVCFLLENCRLNMANFLLHAYH